MKIRNKKTGEVREINPNEASQYGLGSSNKGNTTIPKVNSAEYAAKNPQQGGLGGLLSKAKEAGKGIINTVAPVAKDIGAGIIEPGRQIASIPSQLMGNPKPETSPSAQRGLDVIGGALMTGGTNLPESAFFSPTLASKLGKYAKLGESKAGTVAKGAEAVASDIPKPNLLDILFKQNKIAQTIQDIADKGGNLPKGTIEKYLGKVTRGKVKLPEDSTLLNIGTAKDKAVVENLLKKELQALESEGTLTYEKIKSLETQAGALGKFQKGTAPTIEQSFYRNMQRQYSNILKNQLPKMTEQFEAYSKSKKVSGMANYAKAKAGWVAAGAATYYLINRLLNKTGNAIKSLGE